MPLIPVLTRQRQVNPLSSQVPSLMQCSVHANVGSHQNTSCCLLLLVACKHFDAYWAIKPDTAREWIAHWVPCHPQIRFCSLLGKWMLLWIQLKDNSRHFENKAQNHVPNPLWEFVVFTISPLPKLSWLTNKVTEAALSKKIKILPNHRPSTFYAHHGAFPEVCRISEETKSRLPSLVVLLVLI